MKNIIRDLIKKRITSNLGDIIEDNEKITCYVNQKRIKRQKKDYYLKCFGINDSNKSLANKYQLNKPICYILEGINFEKCKVYIYGYDNCEIIIRNCVSGFDTYIHIDGKCTIDHSIIKGYYYLNMDANDLTIKNIMPSQLDVQYPNTHIYIFANNRINIINSQIDAKSQNIFISPTNELNITNSIITGQNIDCNSRNINIDNHSEIVATDKIILNAYSLDTTYLSAPKVIINDEELNKEEQNKTLRKK